MEKPKVVIFSAKGRDSLSSAQCEKIDKVASVTYVSNLTPISDEQLIEYCSKADYVGLTRRTCRNFHSKIISNLPGLKGLSVYATGTEWIDVKAMERCNIKLKSLRDYSMQTVAEHAMAMLLNCSRRIHLSDRIVRNDLPGTISIRGWELNNKDIGIIGMGRIGRRIADLCKAFGMRVSYYDPHVNVNGSFNFKPFDEIIKSSDIIMLASSVNRDNPEIITADIIGKMKKNVYLVNPSRPELVDKKAVLDAVKERKIAGYAVDEYVFTTEEIEEVEHGRILQTAHSGWYSDEAMERGTEMWIENLAELALNG